MAGGWAKDGAIQDQIDASVKDAIDRVRSRMPSGDSLENCEECDTRIPQARRKALAGVRLCITCQTQLDQRQKGATGYNRRGSKDSQLR